MEDPGTITGVLKEARDGNREAIDRVFALVYDELRDSIPFGLGAPAFTWHSTTPSQHIIAES